MATSKNIYAYEAKRKIHMLIENRKKNMFRVENVLIMSFRRIQKLPIKTMVNQLLSTSKHMLTVNMEQANILIHCIG